MAYNPKGKFDPKIVDAYLAVEKGIKETKIYPKDEVYYYLNPEYGIRHSVKMGECLILDVGLWAGDGPETSPEHYPRRRDFGVVCGNLAVLCRYPERGKIKDIPGKAILNKVHNNQVTKSPFFR